MRANATPLASTVLPDFATVKIWKQNNPSNFNPVTFATRKHKRFCSIVTHADFYPYTRSILQVMFLLSTETRAVLLGAKILCVY